MPYWRDSTFVEGRKYIKSSFYLINCFKNDKTENSLFRALFWNVNQQYFFYIDMVTQ